MRLNRRLSLMLYSLLGLSAFALVSGCAEATGSGAPVTIPTVTVDCATSQCKASSNPYVFVWITTTNCDWRFIDNATAVGSTTAVCNSTSGCRVTMPSSWLLGSNNQSTSTVPSGFYTVCGRINNNRTLPHSVSSNDVTIEVGSVSFVDKMGMITLGQWVDQ